MLRAFVCARVWIDLTWHVHCVHFLLPRFGLLSGLHIEEACVDEGGGGVEICVVRLVARDDAGVGVELGEQALDLVHADVALPFALARQKDRHLAQKNDVSKLHLIQE